MENDVIKSDHDILITLVESVKNNHATILDKIADVKDDVNEIKQGVNLRIADHELRIKALEKLRDELQPHILAETIDKNNQWINDFKLTWKVTLGIASSVAAVVGFVIATIIEVLRLFK